MNIKKEKAIHLRRLGYSYGMIRGQLGISKSTLSNWLNKIEFIPNQEVINRVGEARLKSALHKHRLKFENIAKMKTEACVEVGELSQRDIFMIGIGLYLGEGSKSHEEVRIVNSNPIIIRLAIRWFKKFCSVQSHHLRIAIHGYPDHNIDELLAFWSDTLNIPIEQFIKTTIDTRQHKSAHKKRKLPYGTAHLYIRGGGTLVLGVKNLHRRIMGWIEAVEKQI